MEGGGSGAGRERTAGTEAFEGHRSENGSEAEEGSGQRRDRDATLIRDFVVARRANPMCTDPGPAGARSPRA